MTRPQSMPDMCLRSGTVFNYATVALKPSGDGGWREQKMNNGATTMPMAKAGSYINTLIDMLPLFGVAFSIVMLKGLKGLRAAYVGKSMFDRFLNIVWTSFICACLAVGCAMLAPLLYKEVGPNVTLGIVVFISAGGIRIVDGFIFKHLGIHLIDTTTRTADDRAWDRLSDEDKADAMQAWRDKGEDE